LITPLLLSTLLLAEYSCLPLSFIADLCAAQVCSAPPCQQLVKDNGKPVTAAVSICDPGTGTCRTANLADGTACTYQGGPGSCLAGNCTREWE
jgi:hypothetical protein